MILTHCTLGKSQNVTARKINFVSAVQFEKELFNRILFIRQIFEFQYIQ